MNTHAADVLLTPVRLGDLPLKNRIVMAPMTRNRADSHGIPGDLMVEHYAQRAAAGLIVAGRRSLLADRDAASALFDVPERQPLEIVPLSGITLPASS